MIRVQLLGRFRMYDETRCLNEEAIHSLMITKLLVYMICNKNHRIWTGSEHPRGAGKDRRQMHHRKLFHSCRCRKYQHDQRNMRPVPARNG